MLFIYKFKYSSFATPIADIRNYRNYRSIFKINSSHISTNCLLKNLYPHFRSSNFRFAIALRKQFSFVLVHFVT